MGEVYRGIDLNLKRQVALKVLPPTVSSDPERLARFQREAEVLAALNHPHIAHIHGLEKADGTFAIVMELVEGPTLADRIANGAIPTDEALAIARQIAEALEAAHERGVIHRDLKPENIKVRDDGAVKVLDFGLAKTIDTSPLVGESKLPTVAMTEPGMVLGTTAYMSPEQASGRDVDRRTDIWAFGCILYEMLTARRPFAGDGAAETLARVLTTEPDWSAVPPEVPAAVRILLRRCLERDRQKRLGDVAAIRFALENAADLSAVDDPSGGSPSAWYRGGAARRWGAALLVTSLATGAGGWYVARQWAPTTGASAGATRLTIVPGDPLLGEGDSVFTLSPDGRRLAYVASRDGRSQVYLQDLDQFDARPISGTDGARSVAFSPDGNWLAFVSGQHIEKVALAGGEPVPVGDTALNERNNGLSWPSTDTILLNFGPSLGIWRVPAGGGAATALTSLGPGELEHHFPQILPGGNAILYSALLTGAADFGIVVQSLESGEHHVIASGAAARYFPSGYLAYVQAGTLFVAPFDLARLEVTGTPTVAVQGIRTTSGGSPQIAYSEAGSIAYLPTSGSPGPDTLVWVDRSGVEQPTGVSGPRLRAPRLAPDLRQVAIAVSPADALEGSRSDVWVYDLVRNAPTKVTFDGGSLYSVWSPDSARLAYNSRRNGREEIVLQTFGAAEPYARLAGVSGTNFPFSWSPDGRFIAGVAVDTAGNHIQVYDLDGSGASRAFTPSPFRAGGPTFSHDGRWIAYASPKSDRVEIYMSPFPGPGAEWTISTDGGNEPVWARETGQLFYRRGDAIMEVAITTSPMPVIGTPQPVFEGPYTKSSAFWPDYDVTPDGRRFLMVKSSPRKPATRINVVLGWDQEFQRLATSK